VKLGKQNSYNMATSGDLEDEEANASLDVSNYETRHRRDEDDRVNERTSLLRGTAANSNRSDDHDGSSSSENANNSAGISWYFAVFLIVNAALGAGLLNFAKAFDNAGGILISSIIHLVRSC
jgi:hypothetical protein